MRLESGVHIRRIRAHAPLPDCWVEKRGRRPCRHTDVQRLLDKGDAKVHSAGLSVWGEVGVCMVHVARVGRRIAHLYAGQSFMALTLSLPLPTITDRCTLAKRKATAGGTPPGTREALVEKRRRRDFHILYFSLSPPRQEKRLRNRLALSDQHESSQKQRHTSAVVASAM